MGPSLTQLHPFLDIINRPAAKAELPLSLPRPLHSFPGSKSILHRDRGQSAIQFGLPISQDWLTVLVQDRQAFSLKSQSATCQSAIQSVCRTAKTVSQSTGDSQPISKSPGERLAQKKQKYGSVCNMVKKHYKIKQNQAFGPRNFCFTLVWPLAACRLMPKPL